MQSHWACSRCGQQHAGLPVSFAAEYPDTYARMSPDQREARALVSPDQCIIDEVEFYLRGVVELPIQGTQEVFLWGLWARVFETDFDEIENHWNIEGRERMIGPYKARLANTLAVYSDTLNLPLEVRIRPAGKRPLFVLEGKAHPMALEQARGITPAQAQEYACQLLRGA